MEKPKGVPEEFWHNVPRVACIRAVEESAHFAELLGVRWTPDIAHLPPDWRERMQKMMDESRE